MLLSNAPLVDTAVNQAWFYLLNM